MKKNVLIGILSLSLVAVPTAAFAARQTGFSTPEQAVKALVEANRTGDKTALMAILGPEAEKIISSGDPVADKNGRERFLAAYDEAHALHHAGNAKEVLVVGAEEWPMPIPLVRAHGRWHFDTQAGAQEILDRRIGRNELSVIDTCRAYVEAQRDYAAGHDHAYAPRFISQEGKQDGLYWPVAEGEPESPLGPLFAHAQAEGYDTQHHAQEKPEPYHGYYYKILPRQGAHAAEGAKDYLKGDRMTGGFALLAFPASYGDSGIMTFMVNQNGIVYEKDLGPDTATLVTQITQYDPDNSWQIVTDVEKASAP